MRHCFPLAIALLMALLLATPIVAQGPLINEIRIDQSGGDDDEYFELIGMPGASLDGFTYLVIGDGSGSGTIEAVVDLTGEVIPPSGFFVAAEGTFTLTTADLTTSLNFENSDNVTHLLVQGFSGMNGDDLDTNDDGTLDVEPWTMEVDRIALVEEENPPSGTEFHYGPPSVGPDGAFVPGHSYACPQGWFIGTFDPLGDTDTPGADNPCPVVVEISEIRIDQPGGDDDEYFELSGPPGASLDGLTYLVIGDGGGADGTIESVTDLMGETIPGDGFFVAAEATFILDFADFTTTLNFENGDNVTHLVVRDFSGMDGDDLDTNDDGVLDVTPWSEIVDLIALVEEDNPPSGTEFHYGPPQVGPDGAFVPGHSFLCPGGFVIGIFDPKGGNDTPGAPNACPVNVLISEIRIDQPGGDDDEYFELEGNPGDMLDGLTYLVIGDGTGGSGTIEEVTDLTGEVIPMSGFFVAAEATFSLGTADLTTTLNFENGDNVTHLVVRDFTGMDGDDLDTDDDGTFDVEPWSEIVDLIALIEEDNPPSGTEFHYGPPTVGPDTTFVPGHPSLCPEGWTITAFDPLDGEDTPGAPNFCPPPPMVVELVINEIDYDQIGGDTAEFIELRNNGASPVNLSGFEVVLVNGNGLAIYATIPLPDEDLAAGDYFVICSNPILTPNCDLDTMPEVDLIQNGAPDAVAIVEAVGVLEGAVVIDAVSYEGDVAGFVEGSGSDLEDSSSEANSGISRFPDGTDTDMNNIDLSVRCITPGEANVMVNTTCPSPVTPLEIFDIQGSGALSAFDGSVVTTLDNIVTAVGPDRFYMQTPDARDDADPATSNGIVVFTGGAPTVAVGDQVDVVGEIDEFFDLTEFTNGPTVMIDSSGNPLPTAVDFDATTPSTMAADPHPLERFEGMRVRVLDGVIVAPTNQFGDAAMVASSLVPRPLREPGIEFPGMMGLPVWDGNPEVFEFDPDGVGGMDDVYVSPTPIAAEGVLNFTFGDYQLELTAPPVLGMMPVLPRPVRARNPGEMTIGTLNFLRLFQNQPSMAEYNDRLDKFSRQIREVMGSPDVLAVQEVESLAVLNDLAAQIATDDPGVVYTAELIEGNDVGGIDVGYLVRDTVVVNMVTQIGAATIFPFDGTLLNDRPPLVLEGMYVGSGMEGISFDFTTVVVHQRSLGGIDDPADGDRVRQKRHEQAVFLSQWLGDRQTMNPNERLIALGDFNAYEFTDGYVDVMGQVIGDPADASQALIPGTDLVDPNLTNQTVNLAGNDRYSFVFDNNAQVLDHIVTSVAANPAVVEIQHPLSNADAADDFETMAGTALRSSDHDGLVLFLDTVGSTPLTLTITPSLPLEGGLGVEGEPSCPGFFDFRITGATPFSSVVLLASPNSGTELVPGGICTGTPTGLGRMDVLRRAEADVNGEVEFLDRFLNNPRCDLVFQAMELGRAPCDTSNTATPDSGGGPKE